MTRLRTATLGGGCFWCLEAPFSRLEGIERVTSGYTGGHVENPTYEEVCGKDTGHVEVVQVEFDPGVISYEEILEVFFSLHDPTTPDRQGNDVGPQYRSAIFWHDEEQRATAERVLASLEAQDAWEGAKPVTELRPLERFWPAEEYHQRYFDRNPHQPYCQFVVWPKVVKLRKKYASRLKAGA